MNIIFMRHGEATDNVKELISDKEVYWSVLTENGEKIVIETVNSLPEKIDIAYVSPFPRTIQTAHFVKNRFSDIDFIIDNRIREIYHGKYSGQKNNEELDKVREKQIAGDYFTRFGEFGENKLEIELRLTEFLVDLYKNNLDKGSILIVSHGSVTSFMKRILNLKSPHIKVGKAEVFENVNFEFAFEHLKKLNELAKK